MYCGRKRGGKRSAVCGLEFNPGEIEIRDGFVSAFAQRPFPSLALE
jgi:hypothetical protein